MWVPEGRTRRSNAADGTRCQKSWIRRSCSVRRHPQLATYAPVEWRRAMRRCTVEQEIKKELRSLQASVLRIERSLQMGLSAEGTIQAERLLARNRKAVQKLLGKLRGPGRPRKSMDEPVVPKLKPSTAGKPEGITSSCQAASVASDEAIRKLLGTAEPTAAPVNAVRPVCPRPSALHSAARDPAPNIEIAPKVTQAAIAAPSVQSADSARAPVPPQFKAEELHRAIMMALNHGVVPRGPADRYCKPTICDPRLMRFVKSGQIQHGGKRN